MSSRRRYRLPKRLVVLSRCKFGQEAGCPLPLCALCKRRESFNRTPISPTIRPFSCREDRRKNNVSNVAQRCAMFPLKRSAMDHRPPGPRSWCSFACVFPSRYFHGRNVTQRFKPPCLACQKCGIFLRGSRACIALQFFTLS